MALRLTALQSAEQAGRNPVMRCIVCRDSRLWHQRLQTVGPCGSRRLTRGVFAFGAKRQIRRRNVGQLERVKCSAFLSRFQPSVASSVTDISSEHRETVRTRLAPNQSHPMTITKTAATAMSPIAAAHEAARTAICAAGEFLTFKLCAEEYGMDMPEGPGAPQLRGPDPHRQRVRLH